MSVVLGAIAAASAAGLVGWLVRWRKGAAAVALPAAALVPPQAPAPSAALPDEDAPDPALARLVLQLDDVVSAELGEERGVRHDERWLRGGIVAREGREVLAVVFVAPEGPRDEAVVVFGVPRREIVWATPVVVEVPREPPSALEIGGVMMERVMRRPVVLERIGRGAPAVPVEAMLAEYVSSTGGRAVVLRGASATLAFMGRTLDAARYERMGRGEPPAG